MKKAFIFLFMAIACLSLFCACNNSDEAMQKILQTRNDILEIRRDIDELQQQTGVSSEITSSSSTAKFVFPEKAVAVVGHEFNIYYESVIQCTNLNDYYIDCSVSPNTAATFNKDNSQILGDCFRMTPPSGSEGIYQLTLYLKDKITGKTVVSDSLMLHIIADTPVANKKVLFIGDSLTNAGIFPAEIQYNLSKGGIISLGTRTNTVTLNDNKLTVNHEGRAGWASYDYTTVKNEEYKGATNEFYNPYTKCFDFSYYMNRQSYQGVDVVCINLGTNGVAYIDKTCAAIDEMIASIHAYDKNIKIIVSLIATGSTQDGFGTSVGLMSAGQFHYNAKTLINKYIEKYDNKIKNVSVAEIYFCLDPIYDYNIEAVAVSARNPATKTIQTNNVHPNQYGYLKFADVYYANILYCLNDK